MVQGISCGVGALRLPPISDGNRSTTSSRPVRSVKMSATGSGGCGPGPGPTSGTGSGASNPRKFSEKIALHTQRQAEETAAFQEVMMDITSTRVSLRRRQEEESCPEEERPRLGLLGSEITVSVGPTGTPAQFRGLTDLYQFNGTPWAVFVGRVVPEGRIVVHFRYVVSVASCVSCDANLACLLCYVNVAVIVLAAESVPPDSFQKPAYLRWTCRTLCIR